VFRPLTQIEFADFLGTIASRAFNMVLGQLLAAFLTR